MGPVRIRQLFILLRNVCLLTMNSKSLERERHVYKIYRRSKLIRYKYTKFLVTNVFINYEEKKKSYEQEVLWIITSLIKKSLQEDQNQ